MLVERRRSTLSPDLILRVGLLWVAIAVLALLNNLQEISGQLFPDPDDIMRLQQVRDLLGGQSWFDLTQYRVDAPAGGVETHWSRLVDLPLAGLIYALTPLLGAAGAEMTAIVAVPLLTLLLAMILAARIAWRLTGEEEAGMTCVAMALSMPFLFQMGPLRIDHHGWQIVLALLAMNGLMARNPVRGGWLAGFAIAMWLAISLEGAPLALVMLALVALRWLRNRGDRFWFVHVTRSLALSSLGLFLLTRGVPGWETLCDTIGPAHLAAMGWAALVTTIMSRFEPMPKAGVLGGMLLASSGGLALVWTGTSHCVAGGPLGIDTVLRDFWHVRVSEGLPVWHQDLRTAAQIMVMPVLGIWASLQLTARSHAWLRNWWADYTIVLIAALIVALLVARAGALAAALAAAPLGWQIREWLKRIRNIDRPGKKVVALAGVVCALLPALPLTVLAVAMPARAAFVGTPIGASPVKVSSCRIAESAKELRKLQSAEVFAPLDISPRILLETSHSVIATGHHRGADGMRQVIEISTASVADARRALADRGTRYVALCPDLSEPRFYAEASPNGFIAQLSRGNAPDWLEPVPLKGESSLQAWRIR